MQEQTLTEEQKEAVTLALGVAAKKYAEHAAYLRTPEGDEMATRFNGPKTGSTLAMQFDKQEADANDLVLLFADAGAVILK